MGLLDTLMSSVAGNIQPRTTVPAAQGFRLDLVIEDGDDAFDTAAEVIALIGAVGAWHRIWEMTVPAQQAIHFGYGSPATPMNQGYLFFYAASAAAYDVGRFRLVQCNARRTKIIVVGQYSDMGTHGLVAAIADPRLVSKNDMTALPEKVEYPLVGEDSFLAIDYMPDVLVVETQAAFKIPVTVYE